MSKIRKITASKKKRVENGSRDGVFGSNPHSNGDEVSRFFLSFSFTNKLIIIIVKAIMLEIM